MDEERVEIVFLLFCTLLVAGLIAVMQEFRWRKERLEHFANADENNQNPPEFDMSDVLMSDFALPALKEATEADVLAYMQEKLLQIEEVQIPIDSQKDPDVLLQIQDIPNEPIDLDNVPESSGILVPDESEVVEEKTSVNAGQAIIYFVNREYKAACEKGEFKRPYFWFRLPENSNTKNASEFENSVINTNCYYVIDDWRNTYDGNQDGLTVTKDSKMRGNPLDWYKVLQRVGTKKDEIANGDNPLLSGVQPSRQLTYPDGQKYYVADVNTIDPNEVYTKVCGGKLNKMPPMHLPSGTFIAIVGWPVKGFEIYQNNKRVELTVNNMRPLRDMMRERKDKSRGIETIIFGPKVSTLQTYIFMRELCGQSYLFKRINISFAFKKDLYVKRTTAGDPIVGGTTAELQTRLASFLKVINNARTNVRNLQAAYRNAIDSTNKYWHNSRYSSYPAYNSNWEQRIEREYNARSSRLRWSRWFRSAYNSAMSNARRWRDDQHNNRRRTMDRMYRDLDAWRVRTLAYYNSVYPRMISAQNDIISKYEGYVARINRTLEDIDNALLAGFKEMINKGHFSMKVLSTDTMYKSMVDLYSADEVDEGGKQVPGTERLFIRVG